MEPFAGNGMGEFQLGGVQGLTTEIEPVEQPAQCFWSASINRISQ